jgi:hypothetical protein
MLAVCGAGFRVAAARATTRPLSLYADQGARSSMAIAARGLRAVIDKSDMHYARRPMGEDLIVPALTDPITEARDNIVNATHGHRAGDRPPMPQYDACRFTYARRMRQPWADRLSSTQPFPVRY